AAENWRAEITGRIHWFPGQFDQFLDDLLPSSVPHEPTNDIDNAFSAFNPEKGKEVWSYNGLIAGLDQLVSHFGDKKLFFYNTHGTRMYFPFGDFVKPNSWTLPDVCVSFPGNPISSGDMKTSPWQHIAMIIEAKPTREEDPYPRDGGLNATTAVQSARSARNLLLAHGFLSAFVIGIYGDIVRVIKYDHTSALVSPAFPIHEHPQYLQRFLWHFTHPASPDAIVAGADPTVRRLTVGDQLWITEQLERAGVRDVSSALKEVHKGRRVLVPSGADGTIMQPYLLYRLLDVNSRLFSRATTVWLTIEDTRILGPDGRLIDDPHRDKDMKTKPRILKEAWRQVIRNPEEVFYKRLSDKIPEKDRFGISKLVCGGDLGQLDVLQWERSTPTYPHRYPQHQTFSWAIGGGKKWTCRERSHMRLVIEDVGRTLTKAKNTKELVLALRDAVIGHRLAFEKAGVLHRDVSVGNVLILDEAEDGSFVGFIHDFDYSAMTDVAPGDEVPPSADADRADVDGLESMGVAVTYKNDERRERKGTYYFMALEILRRPVVHGVHHDLESFYWILVWVVLRHTVHNLPEAKAQKVFAYGDDLTSAGNKSEWLETIVDMIDIPDNQPLIKLLRDMAFLVIKSVGSKISKPEPMTYDDVLQLFDEALASPGWPDID
ncbi:hypothetical protein C8T65DRAFT_522545, partial [Cerioporus squamosus]